MSVAVTLVETGTANVASMAAGLARAGAAVAPAAGAADVERAGILVVPGVGSFAAAMTRLTRTGLVPALRERVLAGRPTLLVCLGMQLLFAGSDESPGIAGLGVLPGLVRRLPATTRVPHIGWAPVRSGDGTPRWFYFAHSYCAAEPAPAGWRAGTAEHGVRFVASLERDGVLACQFHPELSGAAGRQLLEEFLQKGESWSQSA